MNASRVAAIIFILFSVGGYYIASAYPPDAALFPKMLFLSIIFSSIVLIIRSFQFEPYKANLVIKQKKQIVGGVLLSIVYIGSMYYIGYYVASAIFILLFAVYLRFQSKTLPVVVAVAFPLVIYGVFELLLNIPVPSASS